MVTRAQHLEAKGIVDKLEPSLSPAESLLTRAVGFHESGYGTGWPEGHGAGSFNMGAVMTGQTEENCTGFKHPDSNPEKAFTGCFKVYPTATAGWRDLSLVLLKPNVREAANRGDLHDVAQAMFDNHYYTGTSKDPAVNVSRYATALRSAVDTIVPATGETDEYSPQVSEARGLGRVLLWLVGGGILVYGAKTLLFGRPSNNHDASRVRGGTS